MMKTAVSFIFGSLFVASLALSLHSCATMFSGIKTNIIIDGDVDEPVTISSSAGEYKDVKLPVLIEVKRRRLNGQRIHVISEHHTFDDIVIQKTVNEWAIVSAAACGTPFLIDLMTNAVSKPKYDLFFLTPKDSPTATDSLHSRKYTVTIPVKEQATRAKLRELQLTAKYPRHEFSATVGVGSNQADRSTSRFVDDIIQPRHMEKDAACGDIFGDSYIMGKIEYHYRFNRKWDIGAMVAWGISSEAYSEDHYYAAEQAQQEPQVPPVGGTSGYLSGRSFTAAPSVRYTWYETRSFRLFSRVSLGMMRHHLLFDLDKWNYEKTPKPYHHVVRESSIDKTTWRMAYQVSPFAMSVGSGPLRLTAEAGYGCLGVCHIGLSVCF